MLADPTPQCAAGAGINQDRWNTCSLKVYRGGAHREIQAKDDRRRRTRGMGGIEFLNHQAIAAAVLQQRNLADKGSTGQAVASVVFRVDAADVNAWERANCSDQPAATGQRSSLIPEIIRQRRRTRDNQARSNAMLISRCAGCDR